MMRVLHADYCENKSMGTPNFAPRLFGNLALRQLSRGALDRVFTLARALAYALGMKAIAAAIIAIGLCFAASGASGADSDWIFLHCAGSNQPIGKESSGYAKNVYIKKDGTAISINRSGDKFYPIPRVGNLEPWRFVDKKDDPDFLVTHEFNPGDMSLRGAFEMYGKIESESRLACHEISNPFMK